MSHNHVTRDIKPMGKCVACDNYHLRQKLKDLKEKIMFAIMCGPLNELEKRLNEVFEGDK